MSELKLAPQRTATLLLVEDSLADIKITQRALKTINARVSLLVARSGRRALKYLMRKGRHAEGENGDGTLSWRMPDLVLLDLNLPGVTGMDVLGHIRSVERLRSVPVIVLTTSPRPQDVSRAYAAGANTYFEKPRSFEDCIELMRVIQKYWLEMALLPGS